MSAERNSPDVEFSVDEVLEIKGWLFKIVLVDPFTNKICMKRISDAEAAELRAKAGEKK
jgi:hypothetical protein